MYNLRKLGDIGALYGLGIGGSASYLTDSIEGLGAVAFTGVCTALGHVLLKNARNNQKNKKREEEDTPQILEEQPNYGLADVRIRKEFSRVRIENGQRGIEYRVAERLRDSESETTVHVPKFTQENPSMYVLRASVNPENEEVQVEGPFDRVEIRKAPRVIGVNEYSDARLILTDLVGEDVVYGGIQPPEKHVTGTLRKDYDTLSETEQGDLVFEMDPLQTRIMKEYLQQEDIKIKSCSPCGGFNFLSLDDVPIKPTLEKVSSEVKGNWKVDLNSRCQMD